MGYKKKLKLTWESFEPDGWFRTGDIGEFTQDLNLRVIDWKKNIFKLQQGVYISAEKLENVYIKSPYIS